VTISASDVAHTAARARRAAKAASADAVTFPYSAASVYCATSVEPLSKPAAQYAR
jgi:hypothetical protein